MAKCLFFWGHTPRRAGEIDASCLSQWWACEFHVDGHRFGSSEHYMMWRKARLFDADDVAAKILAADNPGRAKALGRTVPGFDERRWREHRLDIVVAGNHAKFEQDARLRDFLLATGDRVLAEASPLDRVWGIGLGRDHPDAANPERWRGENLLGIALMRVRHELCWPSRAVRSRLVARSSPQTGTLSPSAGPPGPPLRTDRPPGVG